MDLPGQFRVEPDVWWITAVDGGVPTLIICMPGGGHLWRSFCETYAPTSLSHGQLLASDGEAFVVYQHPEGLAHPLLVVPLDDDRVRMFMVLERAAGRRWAVALQFERDGVPWRRVFRMQRREVLLPTVDAVPGWLHDPPSRRAHGAPPRAGVA